MHCYAGPIPKHLVPLDRVTLAQSRDLARILNPFWQATGTVAYRSPSLSHWIGPADGTRPQSMLTDQNHFVASCYVSERNRTTEVIQARNDI